MTLFFLPGFYDFTPEPRPKEVSPTWLKCAAGPDVLVSYYQPGEFFFFFFVPPMTKLSLFLSHICGDDYILNVLTVENTHLKVKINQTIWHKKFQPESSKNTLFSCAINSKVLVLTAVMHSQAPGDSNRLKLALIFQVFDQSNLSIFIRLLI